MTQQKIDDLFSQRLSNKRSRTNQTTTTIKRDEFDDLFENNSSIKRRRTNNNQSNDVFDFTIPSTLKKKRSMIIDDDDDDDNETKAIDDIFNNDKRKKLRRTTIKKEDSIDLLDMFKTTTTTSFDDFKISKTQTKKIKMFFDDSDLISIRDEQNTAKDYTQIKPVLITSGQWLSKQAETKSTIESSEIPDDERNLMHIQYAPLIIDDDNDVVIHNKKSKKNSKTNLDGKSFQKQLVHSDTSILRKENLQSCYNALLEDLNKPQITLSLNRSTDKKLKQSLNNIDEEQFDQIDFFDVSTRRKKF